MSSTSTSYEAASGFATKEREREERRERERRRSQKEDRSAPSSPGLGGLGDGKTNLYTECGRHSDAWLFNGYTLSSAVTKILGKKEGQKSL